MIERFIEQGSTFAADIDGTITMIGLIVGFWFILAEVILIGLALRYRRREGVRAQYITGDERRQFAWVLVPLILIVGCDVFIALHDVPVWDKVKIHQPEPHTKVRVIAQQWAWTFVHAGPDRELDTADDITTINEMHIEANKVYQYELTSLDVLHSFSVPIFRLKQDAIPGRVINGWFEATITGNHLIQCTEICGIGHGLMPARIHIETAAEHAAWQAAYAPTSNVATAQAAAGS